MGILWSIILYSICRPVHIYLTNKKHFKNTLSTVLILFGILVLLITPIYVFSSMVFRKVSEYSKDPFITELITKTKTLLLQYLPDSVDINSLIQSVEKFGVSLLTDFLNGTIDSLLQIVVMYLLLFFMLNNRKSFESSIVKYLPFHRKHSLKLFKELQQTTLTNLVGQGFIACVQGSLVMVGFLIFGFDDPLFWGVICIFLGFVPLIGAPLVFVPAGLIAISNGDTFSGIGIMIWGFGLVTNIDNVIRIFISKMLANEHPLIILMGVMIGIPIFGIMGLVIGPLLLSWFLLMVKIYEEQKADENTQGDDHISS
jgi:predicted PurR-regulated permease PerM